MRAWLFLGASFVSLLAVLGLVPNSALPQLLRFFGHLLGVVF